MGLYLDLEAYLMAQQTLNIGKSLVTSLTTEENLGPVFFVEPPSQLSFIESLLQHKSDWMSIQFLLSFLSYCSVIRS